MIVIVEGVDKVGKTTLVNQLVSNGFVRMKDAFVLHGDVDSFADYSVGKIDSFIVMAQKLQEEGKNVVIDRLHLTELVYGECENGLRAPNISACFELDMVLANMGAILCYVKASNLALSNELHGNDQTKHDMLFDYYYRMSSMRKIICTYETIDEVAVRLLNEAYTYDIYFASPFFNPEQVEREERMIKHLRGLGFRVFSPKENCHLDAQASQESRDDVFGANCKAIQDSRAVFAVTDGKDMGTIWEAGYAYGLGKPVLYFAETLGNNKFNLMLAQSGRDAFQSQDEVTYNSVVDALAGHTRKFRGDIE